MGFYHSIHLEICGVKVKRRYTHLVSEHILKKTITGHIFRVNLISKRFFGNSVNQQQQHLSFSQYKTKCASFRLDSTNAIIMAQPQTDRYINSGK